MGRPRQQTAGLGRGTREMLVLLQMDGVTMKGLVDSDCSQTLARKQLIGLGGKHGGMIYIECIHRDVQSYE